MLISFLGTRALVCGSNIKHLTLSAQKPYMLYELIYRLRIGRVHDNAYIRGPGRLHDKA